MVFHRFFNDVHSFFHVFERFLFPTSLCGLLSSPSSRGQQCAVALVEQGGSSKLFEALTKLLREKRKGCSMELLAVALRCYDPSLLARHLDVVEEVLRNGLADANAAVRSQARACFHAFEEKFQDISGHFQAVPGDFQAFVGDF